MEVKAANLSRCRSGALRGYLGYTEEGEVVHPARIPSVLRPSWDCVAVRRCHATSQAAKHHLLLFDLPSFSFVARLHLVVI